MLLPVLLGSRHAHPGLVREFAPVAGTDFLARLLPVTYGFATPAAFVCTAVLLLAAALPFRREVPGRERWLWPGLCAAVAASMQWGPTHLLWHAFTTPNGSPYRQTFVLSGVLVLTAWTTPARGGRAAPESGGSGPSPAHGRPDRRDRPDRPDRPDRRAVTGSSAVVLVLALAALPSPVLTPGRSCSRARASRPWRGPAPPRRGRYGVLAALLVTGTLLGQASATTAYADRERLVRLDDYPPLGAEQERRAAALAAADGWPAYRTDPGLPGWRATIRCSWAGRGPRTTAATPRRSSPPPWTRSAAAGPRGAGTSRAWTTR